MEVGEEYQAGAEEIIPLEQGIIKFYGKSLVVVRLPDGRPGVVIRSLCENMQLDRLAQVRRIQRTAPIAGDLVANVRIETEGGQQRVQVLILRSVPYWLTGIDHKRVRPELQEEVLRYQCEAVDVLYAWAQQPRALPAPADYQMIPSVVREQPGAYIAPVEEPGEGAGHDELATYHEAMAMWHYHQAALHAQAWRREMRDRMEDQEARLEAKEAVLDMIPEVLDRLGPEIISTQQIRQVQVYVQQLSKATGKHSATIHEELKTAFERPSYRELRVDEWPQVVKWFEVQMERAKKPRQ
jgi:antirepressor protein